MTLIVTVDYVICNRRGRNCTRINVPARRGTSDAVIGDQGKFYGWRSSSSNSRPARWGSLAATGPTALTREIGNVQWLRVQAVSTSCAKLTLPEHLQQRSSSEPQIWFEEIRLNLVNERAGFSLRRYQSDTTIAARISSYLVVSEGVDDPAATG